MTIRRIVSLVADDSQRVLQPALVIDIPAHQQPGLRLRLQRNEAADESIPALLQRIADDAVEPYTSRYQYFRDMLNIED